MTRIQVKKLQILTLTVRLHTTKHSITLYLKGQNTGLTDGMMKTVRNFATARGYRNLNFGRMTAILRCMPIG